MGSFHAFCVGRLLFCIRDANECCVGEGYFCGFVRRENAFGDELLYDFPGLLFTGRTITSNRF